MLRLRDRVKDSIEFHSATIRALVKRWGWLIWKKVEEVGKKRIEGLISDWQGMHEIYHLPRHLNFSNTRHDASPCPTPNPTFSTFSSPPYWKYATRSPRRNQQCHPTMTYRLPPVLPARTTMPASIAAPAVAPSRTAPKTANTHTGLPTSPTASALITSSKPTSYPTT